MTTRKYWVDWSDRACPEIRNWSEGMAGEPLSLSAAKGEIITHFRAVAAHAHGQVRKAQQTRAVLPSGEKQ